MGPLTVEDALYCGLLANSQLQRTQSEREGSQRDPCAPLSLGNRVVQKKIGNQKPKITNG